MKKAIRPGKKIPPKLVRIDEYTWIEKKADEPDEVVRQRFLMKLARFLDSPKLQPGI
jgi:hypothetical protein